MKRFSAVALSVALLMMPISCGGGDSATGLPDYIQPDNDGYGDTPTNPNTPTDPSEPITPSTPTEPNTPTQNLIDSFYWGNWVDMLNGSTYLITNDGVYGGYHISSGLGSITKESENVLLKDNHRLFRKGGSKKSFNAKVASIDEKTSSRAVSIGKQPINGRNVKRQNTQNTADTETVVSNNEGVVEFADVVAESTQTITIESTSGEEVKLDLTPHFDGEDMGIIPVLDGGVNFKTTYTISDNVYSWATSESKYQYGNNYATYYLTLNIQNVGDEECSTAVYTVSTDDKKLQIDGRLSGALGTVEKRGEQDSKKLSFKVNYGQIFTEYKDAKINVKIYDATTQRTWEDNITLRFYKKPVFIDINAYHDSNSSASLHGFIVAPDNSSEYFLVSNGYSKIISVPWKEKNNNYKLAFSGASASDEIYYSVNIYEDETNKTTFDLKEYLTTEKIIELFTKGEPNNTEDSAGELNVNISDTVGYISKNDIDYYNLVFEEVEECSIYHFRQTNNGGITDSDYDLWDIDKKIVTNNESIDVLKKSYDGFEAKRMKKDGKSILIYYDRIESNEVPKDYVFINGIYITGNEKWTPSSEIFKSGQEQKINDYLVCDHEVTQAEYTAIMGENPSKFTSNVASGEVQENRPVEWVSWYDAIVYCNKRSQSEGLTPCYKVNGEVDITKWNYTPHKGNSISGTITCDFETDGYRLPTEAEWEYAARGDQSYTYAGSNTIGEVAWYYDNSSSKTHEVKKKKANGYGLYDMSGNVWEWCWDSSGNFRYERGGSYRSSYYFCGVSYRDDYYADYRGSDFGFRLFRTSK